MNLIVELKELLGGDISVKAASLVGEKEDKVKLAIEGLVPTIIGGIMKRATNEAGATTLMNVIQKEVTMGLFFLKFQVLYKIVKVLPKLLRKAIVW
jgi:hypothetical protein